jgi:hypothetical protein
MRTQTTHDTKAEAVTFGFVLVGQAVGPAPQDRVEEPITVFVFVLRLPRGGSSGLGHPPQESEDELLLVGKSLHPGLLAPLIALPLLGAFGLERLQHPSLEQRHHRLLVEIPLLGEIVRDLAQRDAAQQRDSPIEVLL